MGRNNYFKFKQFTIHQEKAAMKVGTDGVLLGAWVGVDNCQQILDVGTGTGLIALMLAQRSKALITAIEIEENATNEAQSNVLNSPWNDRINVHNISFQEFEKSTDSKYDLIVSNPPFFSDNYKAGCEKRNLARHTDSLPFADLVACACKLLHENGRLAMVLPLEPALVFQKIAEEKGLFSNRITNVKPKPQKEVNRVLMEFTFRKQSPIRESMTIYNESGSAYSKEHIQLSKDFYLRF